MLLGICFILFLWLAVSHWRMRRALRWWFKQEAIERSLHSDYLQNQLVQDLFAVRLGLQCLSTDRPEELVLQQQAWLSQAETMHHSLIDLSAALTQPYLSESLPLAIQHSLKQWQQVYPHCTFQPDLPQDWPQEPLERSRMILSTLETLLKLALPAKPPATVLKLSLSHASSSPFCDRPCRAILTVKITYPDRSTRTAVTCAKEFVYLRYCFRCLTPGRCRVRYQSHEATWRFQWKH